MTETTTAKREYKLAGDVFTTNYGQIRREVLEFAGDHRNIVLTVASDDAVDVLEALRQAYQAGQVDALVDATVAKGDVIRIAADCGDVHRMVVSHVERHIITLADLAGNGEPS